VFLTGVAFNDSVAENNFYDVGEGLGGIKIEAVNQSTNEKLSTTTMGSGGYGINLQPGTYQVTFSDNNINHQATVTIDSKNIKLDLDTSELEAGELPNNDLLITGTPGNDTLIGGYTNQKIRGLAGNDYLDGASGTDSY
jgi:Ca2+-binding RTX toxin-like protein